jgi:hypothetical protein
MRGTCLYKLYTAAGSSLIWTHGGCVVYIITVMIGKPPKSIIFTLALMYSSSTGSFASAWHLATPFCFPSYNTRNIITLGGVLICRFLIYSFLILTFSVLFILFVFCISYMETFNCVTSSNQRWHWILLIGIRVDQLLDARGKFYVF